MRAALAWNWQDASSKVLRLKEVVHNVIGFIGGALPNLQTVQLLSCTCSLAWLTVPPHEEVVTAGELSNRLQYLCKLVDRVIRYVIEKAKLLFTKLVQAVQEASKHCTSHSSLSGPPECLT